jgi:hypothetical protein
MASSVDSELARDEQATPESRWSHSRVIPALTFGELLHLPTFSSSLKENASRWAKRRIALHRGTGLEPIPRAIYYALMAKAICAQRTRPTRLSPEEIGPALRWAATRSWIDPETQQLFDAANAIVADGSMPQ